MNIKRGLLAALICAITGAVSAVLFIAVFLVGNWVLNDTHAVERKSLPLVILVFLIFGFAAISVYALSSRLRTKPTAILMTAAALIPLIGFVVLLYATTLKRMFNNKILLLQPISRVSYTWGGNPTF